MIQNVLRQLTAFQIGAGAAMAIATANSTETYLAACVMRNFYAFGTAASTVNVSGRNFRTKGLTPFLRSFFAKFIIVIYRSDSCLAGFAVDAAERDEFVHW